MEDFLRDAGLKFASTMPVTLGGIAVVCLLCGLGIYKIWTDGGWSETARNVVVAVLAGVIAAALAALPVAWSEAKAHCESLRAAAPAAPVDLNDILDNARDLPDYQRLDELERCHAAGL